MKNRGKFGEKVRSRQRKESDFKSSVRISPSSSKPSDVIELIGVNKMKRRNGITMMVGKN